MNPYVRELLATFEDPILFEFGTYDAADTWEMARFGFSKFFTFEADPRNIEFIRKRGLPEGVELIPHAIGAHAGTATFHLSSRDDGSIYSASSSLRAPNEKMKDVIPWLRFIEQVKVKVVTLDEFCRERGISHIDFIWADIQGGECDMVAGGQEMLKKTKYLFMECEKHQVYDGQWSYEEALRSLPGWEVIEKFPNDVFLKNTAIL